MSTRLPARCLCMAVLLSIGNLAYAEPPARTGVEEANISQSSLAVEFEAWIETVRIQLSEIVKEARTVLEKNGDRERATNEGRSEFGPPILMRFPQLPGLHKNTGYGRDAESLMLMVTPRIIIQEEEEDAISEEAGTPPE